MSHNFNGLYVIERCSSSLLLHMSSSIRWIMMSCHLYLSSLNVNRCFVRLGFIIVTWLSWQDTRSTLLRVFFLCLRQITYSSDTFLLLKLFNEKETQTGLCLTYFWVYMICFQILAKCSQIPGATSVNYRNMIPGTRYISPSLIEVVHGTIRLSQLNYLRGI